MQAFKGLKANDHPQGQDLGHKAKAKAKDLRCQGQGQGQGLRFWP